jgi:hypothetical protein
MGGATVQISSKAGRPVRWGVAALSGLVFVTALSASAGGQRVAIPPPAAAKTAVKRAEGTGQTPAVPVPDAPKAAPRPGDTAKTASPSSGPAATSPGATHPETGDVPAADLRAEVERLLKAIKALNRSIDAAARTREPAIMPGSSDPVNSPAPAQDLSAPDSGRLLDDIQAYSQEINRLRDRTEGLKAQFEKTRNDLLAVIRALPQRRHEVYESRLGYDLAADSGNAALAAQWQGEQRARAAEINRLLNQRDRLRIHADQVARTLGNTREALEVAKARCQTARDRLSLLEAPRPSPYPPSRAPQYP